MVRPLPSRVHRSSHGMNDENEYAASMNDSKHIILRVDDGSESAVLTGSDSNFASKQPTPQRARSTIEQRTQGPKNIYFY